MAIALGAYPWSPQLSIVTFLFVLSSLAVLRTRKHWDISRPLKYWDCDNAEHKNLIKWTSLRIFLLALCVWVSSLTDWGSEGIAAFSFCLSCLKVYLDLKFQENEALLDLQLL
ncbi:Uu.00g081750.m01.CDS01 [Anthostomella pinea]|uniref:Uu.00g081750.m01.CDS01 n=1 Tax=Anthostomella pinea TaxID=933095 RepID=A0AAI8YH18_9PEZI|nr:Uu.00g081750.m01.CDS01 [Anthostomella pinea]